MRHIHRLFWLALLSVACAKQVQPAADGASAPTTAVNPELAGTKWLLVKFTGMKNTDVRVPPARDKYAITFGADGKVAVQADCNRGTGTWSTSERSGLRFSQLAVTTQSCQSGSMDEKFFSDFQYMTSWITRDGRLYISLRADRGTYEFESS